jgi:hypothetical protein
MKNLALSAIVAFVAMTSIAPVANAGSHYFDDDDGYPRWKRVKVCEY